MSPADTLFENRAVVLLERSAKWLRTKKELMEAFLRAEKKKEKDSQPHQPRKLQYTYHLAMLSSSSTLTTLLVQLDKVFQGMKNSSPIFLEKCVQNRQKQD